MKLSIIHMVIIVIPIVLGSACLDNGNNYLGTEHHTDTDLNTDIDFRQEMRDMVIDISSLAKGIEPDFIVIPQNGQELLTENGESGGVLIRTYIEAIDGVGREDLFYGYNADDLPTPVSEQDYMIDFLDNCENNGIQVLVTDYCSTPTFVDNSYFTNSGRGFISFAADHRELDNIPEYPEFPHNVNSNDITSLGEAENFLYLIDPGLFPDKTDFLDSIGGTDYDIIIIDLFWNEIPLSKSEVALLQCKTNGASRLVIAYMSIGEAEDYRYYWQADWENSPPSWLLEENPNWAGNYKVRYWDEDWQNIIYMSDDSYLSLILDAGFDGVYLDIIDAFKYFEEK